MPDGPPSQFSRYPMLWLGTAFAAGILAYNFAEFDLVVVFAAAILIASAGVLLCSRQAVAGWLMLGAFAAAGLGSAIIERRAVSPDRIKVLYDSGIVASGDPVEVEGVLLGRPEPGVEGVFLDMRTEKLRYRGHERSASGRVRLFLVLGSDPNLRSEISNLKYGSLIRVATTLEREDEFLNPGVIRKREILDRLGVDATGSVKSPKLIEHLADESVFLPLAWVYDQRAKVIESFRQNLSPRAAGVMIASLLGNKHFLDKRTADLFREGGTFHILVISGLHITFIGGIFLLIVRAFTRSRWIQFFVTTVVLWAYTLAVGADVPVVRAALMFTIMLFSYCIYRQARMLNTLGFCGLILLAWRPSNVWNPSFQLTFVSVAAIVAIAVPLIENLRRIGSWTPTRETPLPPNVPDWLRRVCETLYWEEPRWKYESKRDIWSANLMKTPFFGGRLRGDGQRIVRYLIEGTLFSLAVQLCMLPLSIVYFHRVSIISVVLNLWVGFFIALESLAAVTGFFASQINETLGRGFFLFAEIFGWLMMSVPQLFADNWWLSFRLPAYTGWKMAIYFLFIPFLIVLTVSIHRWRPFDLKGVPPIASRLNIAVVSALILLIMLATFHPFSRPEPDGRLRIDFLDVGQGDAALVTFPDGRTMLVDGGGRRRYNSSADREEEAFEPDVRGIGESVVSEFLWHRGLSMIDIVVATHGDADHVQGLTDVAKNFRIGKVFLGGERRDDVNVADLTTVLRARGVYIETAHRGDRMTIGDVTVEVLNPATGNDGEPMSENNSSLVLKIGYGSRTILLTGDIEQRAEDELVQRANLQADVIKVAHHGSRTSSTPAFVAAVRPSLAVVSAGRRSQFGHPHAEVAQRWRDAGVEFVTTGERGTISVSTNGSDLVKTHYLNSN